MLRVRNLPPEPTWRDWLQEELPTIKGLGLCVVALLCLSILATPPAGQERRSLLAEADGALVAMPLVNPSTCDADQTDSPAVCLPEREPPISALSLLSP